MRKLQTSDVFTIVDMLKKVAGETLPKIIKSVSTTDTKKGGEENRLQVGILILTELYDNLRDDLLIWLADLNEMAEEEFMQSDPETVLGVIEEFATNEKYQSFFLRAYNLYKKIAG